MVTNRNQPTGLPISSSIFCHRPVTDGSVAAEFATLPSANNPARKAATTHLLGCSANAALHSLSNQLNRSPPVAHKMLIRHWGDLTTQCWPRSLSFAVILLGSVWAPA